MALRFMISSTAAITTSTQLSIPGFSLLHKTVPHNFLLPSIRTHSSAVVPPMHAASGGGFSVVAAPTNWDHPTAALGLPRHTTSTGGVVARGSPANAKGTVL